MKALLTWLDNRTGAGETCSRWASEPIPGGAGFNKTLPAAILFAFFTQAVTGFIIWMYYSPSAQTAWESLNYLQQEVAGGAFLRAVHHYAGHATLVLLIFYFLLQIFNAAYRAPREMIFWITLFLILCALGLLLTGDLLAWTNNGYTSTQIRTQYLTHLPLIGEPLYRLAVGGTGFGHLTLTRFVGFHIGLFAGGTAVLLCLHYRVSRRANAQCAAQGNEAEPFWPRQAAWNVIACLILSMILVAIAFQSTRSGNPWGSPADPDPANAYAAARPEWAFLPLYEFARWMTQQFSTMPDYVPVFIIPGLLVLFFAAMPLTGKIRYGHGFNVVFTLILIAAAARLAYDTVVRDKGDAAYAKAVVEERKTAARAIQLASLKGVPSAGVLELLKRDPATQGPRIFKQLCATCHEYEWLDRDSDIDDITAKKPTASNLCRFASREWVAGLLDPKRIGTEEYFGNTKFAKGPMVGFVKETLADLNDEEKEKVKKAAAAVSAEAALPSQREMDAKDAAMIDEGRAFIQDDFGCTDCHKFRGKGTTGTAPELTGYGSKEWMKSFIGNPRPKEIFSARKTIVCPPLWRRATPRRTSSRRPTSTCSSAGSARTNKDRADEKHPQ